MEKKIVAGTVIALIAVAGIALALGHIQHYPGAAEAAEAECEGGDVQPCDRQPCDRPSGILSYYNRQIENYRSGQSDCVGGIGSWNTASCLQNAIIRWSGESLHAPAFNLDIERCYWRWSAGWPENCYTDWDGGSQDDPVYYTYIGNEDRGFYHAVCAEHEGGGMGGFDNWRFFQFDDDDINPDDGQMPCGNATDDTYVLVQSTNYVCCDDIDATTSYSWNIDENCDVSSRKVRLVHVTDEDVAGIKSEIEELRKVPEMRISGTAIHRAEKTVMIWVYEFTPENQQLHGKMIDGWKIIVGESPKPPEEPEDIEITVETIKGAIDELRKVPEMQISGTAIHRAEKTVMIWVYELTPENQQLKGKMNDEWVVIVGTCPKLPEDREFTAERIDGIMGDLEKTPGTQIAAWDINETEKEVTVWVYELTPENQLISEEKLGEWKINVCEDQKPPE